MQSAAGTPAHYEYKISERVSLRLGRRMRRVGSRPCCAYVATWCFIVRLAMKTDFIHQTYDLHATWQHLCWWAIHAPMSTRSSTTVIINAVTERKHEQPLDQILDQTLDRTPLDDGVDEAQLNGHVRAHVGVAAQPGPHVVELDPGEPREQSHLHARVAAQLLQLGSAKKKTQSFKTRRVAFDSRNEDWQTGNGRFGQFLPGPALA